MRHILLLATLLPALTAAPQAMHDHPAPEKLGTVSFPTSCQPAVQPEFNRAVALLHSFAYRPAEDAFRGVAAHDPQCAMAHWGIAITHFRQLWEPHLPPDGIAAAQNEIRQAATISAAAPKPATPRERGFIQALSLLLADPATPYSTRAANYEAAMHDLAATDPVDVEAQLFYALALLSNAPPTDKTHARQKQALALLEPLYQRLPSHPGIAHYIIHACDSQELAARGLPAARAYARIAPSAPHALHMPSHIFTRLGMWDDSIASNRAARTAAHQQSDTGEELHAMDYLVYAYLQSGRSAEAAQLLQQLSALPNRDAADFKSGYAATVMPIRYALEQGHWAQAAVLPLPPSSALPQVRATALWARGLANAHTHQSHQARQQAEELHQIELSLRASGADYWAGQVDILYREVLAWIDQADARPADAVAALRSAADDEDAVEKLPATPGPVIPAREQLGELFLAQRNFTAAAQAFKIALVNAPQRRAALEGAARAANHH